mgnify:CR=1 FL=1|jgi:beta-glucosidase
MIEKRLGLVFALLLSHTLFAKENVAPPVSVQPETLKESWAVGWWMPRHEEVVKRVAKGNVDLLMIGDSITHWWQKFGKQRRGAQMVWDEYYGGRNAVNLGFAGDRTENVLWRLQNGEVAGISPKLAVLMIGTNNAGHRKEDPQLTALGIQAILSELRTRLPTTKILLLAIFPRGANEDDEFRKLNTRTNALIGKFADDKTVFFLDVNSRFLVENGNLNKRIMPDLLHPNEQGYRIWAEAMEPTIKKLMGE